MVGKVTARFVWYAIDTDIDPDNRRREIDEQTIMFVTTDPCPKFFTCPSCSGQGGQVRCRARLYLQLRTSEL